MSIESMEYKYSEAVPIKQHFINLYQTTGWNDPDLFTDDQLYSGICNSWYSISIYHDSRLIGFGRIVSDGIYQTLICDVIVHPAYQMKGVGTKVMNALLKKCDEEGIRWIQIFCSKGKQDFYQKLGFEARNVDAPGMSLFLK